MPFAVRPGAQSRGSTDHSTTRQPRLDAIATTRSDQPPPGGRNRVGCTPSEISVRRASPIWARTTPGRCSPNGGVSGWLQEWSSTKTPCWRRSAAMMPGKCSARFPTVKNVARAWSRCRIARMRTRLPRPRPVVERERDRLRHPRRPGRPECGRGDLARDVPRTVTSRPGTRPSVYSGSAGSPPGTGMRRTVTGSVRSGPGTSRRRSPERSGSPPGSGAPFTSTRPG